jgi:tetratricopeptide (TPR) repeat protein/serine phosphatase RsbU (regulator of sigma subunit)
MKRLDRIPFMVVFLFFAAFYSSQNTDSLKRALKTVKNDTVKIKLLNQLVETTTESEWPEYNRQLLELTENKLEKENTGDQRRFYLKYFAAAQNNLGLFCQKQGEMPKALEYYTRSLNIFTEIKDKTGSAFALNNLGYMYYNLGDIKKALECQHKSLKLQEEMGDKFGVASAFSFIAPIYETLGETSKAMEYYTKCLKLYEDLNYRLGVALTLNNIGSICQARNQYEKALDYLNRASKIYREINDAEGLATSLLNIGNIYHLQKQDQKGLEYFLKALKIQESISDKKGMAITLHNIGSSYESQRQLDKAMEYGLQSLKISKELAFPKNISDAALLLKTIYQAQNKCPESLKMFELYVTMRDSINNEENRRASFKKQLQYVFEKKAAADSVKTAQEQKVKDAEIKAGKAQLDREKTTRYALFGGLALVIVFSGFLYNRFTTIRKQKSIIETQKTEVEKQKVLVEEHRKGIIDSITYAKRLQQAILPPLNFILQYLPESFVLYKPKDIVAGDFYWMHVTSKSEILIAAADCTGHGVPGAIVSVVCSNALNRTVKEFGITDPGKILDKVRELVIETFEKSESEVKDGMDISLVSIHRPSPKGNIAIEWAGANNPLWIISSSNGNEPALTELKPDKQPIGKYAEQRPFTTHALELKKGDSLFVFTDGYPDQFGGPKGKKFKYKQLEERLLSNVSFSPEEQKQKLNKTFEDWKGLLEQVDDVCVIGIRL